MSTSLTSDASDQWKSVSMNEAWRLLTALLRHGHHPVTSSDLAVGCTSEVVEFLCRIPGSPLMLTNDGLVEVLPCAMLAFVESVLRAVGRLTHVVDFGVDGSMNLCRKRKGPVIALNANKRRSVLLLDEIGDSSSSSSSSSCVGYRIQYIAAERIQTCRRTSVFNFLNDKCLQYGLNFFSQYIAMNSLPPSHGVLHSNGMLPAIVEMHSGRITRLANICYSVHNGAKDNGILLQKIKTDAICISKADVSLQIMEGTERDPVALKLLGDKQNTQATCEIVVANVADVIKTGLEEEENNEAKTSDDASARLENHHFTMPIKLDSGCAELCTHIFGEPGEHVIDAARATIDAHLSDNVISDSGQIWVGPQSFSRAGIEASVNELDPIRKSSAKGVAKHSRRKTSRRNQNVLRNETADFASAEKNPPEAQKLPVFDSFVVEEEEGSGGYGTVYRARRKTDEKTFAIKCPHANAHSYHVNNELKMLQQFGGKSFIIKFEGSFRNDNSECFVLEHVKHDRPEVLKKEIDVSELQWYGFCMLKALASLHKHGIVHRDVKPGNFLFCRELCKGYLIDFNLALDLNYKYRANNRSDSNSKGRLLQSIARGKLAPPMQSRKTLNCKPLELVSKHVNKESCKLLLPKNARRKTDGNSGKGLFDFESRNPCESQAADASALTSVKDATSNRTPSVDRLREPIPCHGRRELINLVQEVMQNPNQKISPAPISQRKRIAAPAEKVERMSTIVSPMPLYSNGVTVSTAGMLKNKGDDKHKNEGPCVGTRGFRAPEVLFKSLHQDCKIDMWSAGVTLLYLMIGRTPFGCEAEQNIKEIAKLRGSEALWEVAKLHNRELSFPTELLDIQSLRFMELKSWCQKNTKRPEFLERIPDTLFDLLDKCLMVNPRLRISAEEALMHDFFSPCRESLRKQRLLRISRDSQTATQLEERK